MSDKVVILANGKFPDHSIPLGYLKEASKVVCCDGAAINLINYGIEPIAIVGDFDSVDKSKISGYSDRFHIDPDQETNDLTKAVNWCLTRGITDVTILGATGLREDHTIGNISLLAEYAQHINVRMVTDTGEFIAILKTAEISAFPGQNISIFSIDPSTEITSNGLKYPLKSMKLKNWWMATLNEAMGNHFTLTFEGGTLIIYRQFPGN